MAGPFSTMRTTGLLTNILMTIFLYEACSFSPKGGWITAYFT
jgi:hypothetical protein